MNKFFLRLKKRRITKNYTINHIRSSGHDIYIAYHGDIKIGKAFIYIKKRQAILIDIVVYHLFRNKGIGSKLIKYIINELKGSDIICIKGEIKNKSVISFYLKLGFKYNEHGYVYKTLRDN